ncbi:MAG: hypothetical protein QM820_46080 [Minicystis sp.]
MSARRGTSAGPTRVAGLALALSLIASSAGAQTSADRVATAQALFETAATLARAGKWAEACPKLEESQRLDPAMGTQFHLAACYENVGRPTSAWSLFLDVAVAARAAGNPVREATARARANALEPRLPRITLILSDAAAAIPGLEVSRDRIPVKPVVLGTAVPVDFGSHVVRAAAPGRAAWQTTAEISELGQRIVIRVPLLPREAAPGAAPAGPDAPPTAGLPPIQPAASPARRLAAPRVAAIAVGTVGLLSLAAGGALGLAARSSWSDADAACPSHRGCTPAAHDRSVRALTLATGSTITFVAGGAGVATALVLWIASPKSPPPVGLAPLAGPGIAGLVATGRF